MDNEPTPGLTMPLSHWCPRCQVHNRCIDYHGTFLDVCPVCEGVLAEKGMVFDPETEQDVPVQPRERKRGAA